MEAFAEAVLANVPRPSKRNRDLLVIMDSSYEEG